MQRRSIEINSRFAVVPQEGDIQFGGHDFHRLANGNVIIYNGGTADATRTSRVHEYQLDEVNKIELKDLKGPRERRPDELMPAAIDRATKQPKS